MPDGFYPWAIWYSGHPDKLGYGSNVRREGKGAVVHSAEGALEAALRIVERPSGPSWHFTVTKLGSVFQHYDLQVMTWHARTPANYHYVGIECEGVAGEPLTDEQIEGLVNLLKWVSLQDDWPGFVRGLTLFEHNEFVATACPSGRIPWDTIIPRLEGASLEPAPVPSAGGGREPSPEPAPSTPDVDRQLTALTAALAVLWTSHSLEALPYNDKEVLRALITGF